MNDAMFGTLCTFAGGLALLAVQFGWRRVSDLSGEARTSVRTRIHSLSNELQILQIGLTKIEGVVANIAQQAERIAAIERDLTAFKLQASKEYVSGTWLKDEIGHVNQRLDRIEAKVDARRGARAGESS